MKHVIKSIAHDVHSLLFIIYMIAMSVVHTMIWMPLGIVKWLYKDTKILIGKLK